MSITNYPDADFTPDIPNSGANTGKQSYNPTGSFRFWAQKVLPTVYDDSLSYYEILTKVVNYLNAVIQNVDSLNESVDNTNSAFDTLQGYVNDTKDTIVSAYNELQSYVNTYFDSLDVQEEINAKLDGMASDGSLSSIVSPFIPSLVSDWLSQNITPTSPAIDASLSISGAGADAKVTGDEINNLKVAIREHVNKNGYREVNELNTTFFTIGDNRYNVDDVTDGVQLNQVSEGTHEASGFSTTNSYVYVGDLTTVKFMRLNTAGTMYITDSAYYQLYDSDFNRIGNRAAASSVDVSDATWMLVSNSTEAKSTFMIIDNSLEITKYIPYSFTFNYLSNELNGKVDKNGKKQVNEQNTTFFSTGDNKFNSSDVVDNTQLNQASDGTHEASGFCTSDYIDISDLSAVKFLRLNAAGTTVMPESFYYTLYNANKDMIATRALASTVDVSSAAYIRVSLSMNDKSTAMICDSNLSVEEYIPFGYAFVYSEKNNTVTIYPSDHVLSKLIENKGKDIYFADGNYDIIAIYQDYYGADFFDNYAGYSADALFRGLPVYRGTTMKFSPNARFVCNYNGSNTSVRQNFSAFALEGGVTFDGLNIVGSGIRNIIHDDFDNNYVGNTVIKNCHFTHDYIIIAGGLAAHEVVEIYNNYFERTDDTTQVFDFSYHQNSVSGAQSELIIKDNYCSKGISIRYYGASELITDCLISNNSIANDIEYRAENETATIENIRILSWNNIIRNT